MMVGQRSSGDLISPSVVGDMNGAVVFVRVSISVLGVWGWKGWTRHLIPGASEEGRCWTGNSRGQIDGNVYSSAF